VDRAVSGQANLKVAGLYPTSLMRGFLQYSSLFNLFIHIIQLRSSADWIKRGNREKGWEFSEPRNCENEAWIGFEVGIELIEVVKLSPSITPNEFWSAKLLSIAQGDEAVGKGVLATEPGIKMASIMVKVKLPMYESEGIYGQWRYNFTHS